MKNDVSTFRSFGLVLFLSICNLCYVTVNGQTTWIANANSGAATGPNTFTGTDAITEALAAASNGDLIYVVPSGNAYDAIQVSKEVLIFGGGYNPRNSSSPLSIINGIDLSASNVRLSGLRIPVTINSSLVGSISNIMIDKCHFRSLHLTTNTAVGNLVVQNCVIGDNTSLNEGQLNHHTGVTNARLLNSIIYIRSASSIPSGLVGAAIENNLFVGVGNPPSTQGALGTVTNCLIRNNIFYGVQPKGGNLDDNTQEYNISFDCVDCSFSVVDGNTSSNNLEGVDPQFVNMTHASSFQFSFDVSLQATSPGKGTGSDGKDRGVFGGLIPYDIHGSPLPTIQSISAPTMVGEGSDLTVRIQAIGN